MTSGDDTLLRRSLGGDREAFETLTERYRGQLFRFLVTMIGDENEAEDLVQDAIRRAYENLTTYQKRAKFSSWLYQIAVNLARNYRRDRKRHAKPGAQTALDAHPERRRGVISSVVRRETAEQLARAVDRLPPSLKEAFVLRFVEDIDYPEIEKITGIEANTLYVRAHRAKTLLRQQLGSVVDTAWKQT